MSCQMPQGHPTHCGCAPAGTEQVSSAWLAQLRKEYLQFAGACDRLTAERDALAQRCRELEAERDEAITDGSALLMKLDAEEAEVERLRVAMERIRIRAEAFAEDGIGMGVDSVGVVAEIASKALESST